jgi:hypothetical protein
MPIRVRASHLSLTAQAHRDRVGEAYIKLSTDTSRLVEAVKDLYRLRGEAPVLVKSLSEGDLCELTLIGNRVMQIKASAGGAEVRRLNARHHTRLCTSNLTRLYACYEVYSCLLSTHKLITRDLTRNLTSISMNWLIIITRAHAYQ